MAMDVSKVLDMEYNEMLEDLSLLWQGAAMKSDTIKFAIYKLSNPDKDKPDEGAVRKVLSTIAGMSTFLGAGTGNPIMASAALIGGNTLGIMSQDTKALNYKYTQVTDADMIILVRKVDELQQKVVDCYYDYMTARLLYDMTSKMVKEREINYKKSQSLGKEVVLVTDTFYREAIDEHVKARGTFFEKRSQLEQLVGNDIFRQFEEVVDKRNN
jgi:CMP-2-keto-3-deoxyoctulosonic acid synthetase